MNYELHHGDCLEVMRTLPDASVDCVLTDPPYGTTACKWDSVIPFEPMWEQLKRIAKPAAAICLFGSQPFTSALINSNRAGFKYCWYWNKNIVSGFQFATSQPTRAIEEICVFYDEQPIYNRQPTESLITNRVRKVGAKNGRIAQPKKNEHKLGTRNYASIFGEYVAPRNVLDFPCVPRATGTVHPTQKPVALLRYLIRTYTQEGETVLDFTMGSGSTGVACELEGRKFIGIEKDDEYFRIATERIEGVRKREPLFMEQAA